MGSRHEYSSSSSYSCSSSDVLPTKALTFMTRHSGLSDVILVGLALTIIFPVNHLRLTIHSDCS